MGISWNIQSSRLQQVEPRQLTVDETNKLKSARERALKALKEVQRCKDAIVAILDKVAGSTLIPDQVLLTPNGTRINSPALSNFVYNGNMGTSSLLNRYNSISVLASGRSGRDGNTTTYGVADRRSVNEIHVETIITWNSEYFRLGDSARALHSLHEILHDYATDTDIGNAIALISGDRSGPNNSFRTFNDGGVASIYITITCRTDAVSR